MVQNDTLGFTATTSTKREGDLLWTDGDGPNASNIWIDNSAYSYNQIIATINKVWLTLYLTVTYDTTNPIQCIIKSQEKWEG